MKKEISFTLGDSVFHFHTGQWAKQADSSVVGRYGDTVVLVAATRAPSEIEGLDFVPLTVEYREKNYAAGKIPGGFIKREGRPTDREILVARVIDRSIRPLIDRAYRKELQVIAWVLSHDQENNPDVVAINSASLALMISPVPFDGPLAAVRVGRVDGEFVVNPTFEQLERSTLDILVAGKESGIVMVEAGARFEKEEIVADAIEFAHTHIQKIVQKQKEFISQFEVTKDEVIRPELPEEYRESFKKTAEEKVREALSIQEKKKRREKINRIPEELLQNVPEEERENFSIEAVRAIVEEVEKHVLREKLFSTGQRIDGRSEGDIRPITCEVGVLPRTHGSAIFTRGETQAVVVTTLGTREDKQIVEALEGESAKHFMLHYNFPPFCVGEVRPIRGPGRREIGHGALAERALEPVVPGEEEFPYTIRVVSDILESNGSSSMATVCGASLSLMDAGVPISAPVAGVAMGLVIEGEEYRVLTDILGDEDHMGDMDFKVAGTREGITALQMDIKVEKIDFNILREALRRAKDARLKILDIMDSVIDRPRVQVSPYAPRVKVVKIKVEKIKDLIGPGGRNIKSIIDKTGANIDINQDGTVYVFAGDEDSLTRALELINYFTEDPEVGKVYTGRVVKLFDYGALVEILPGAVGLLHRTQIDFKHPKRVSDVLKVGDTVEVKLIKMEEDGKLYFSRKEVLKEKMHRTSNGQS